MAVTLHATLFDAFAFFAAAITRYVFDTCRRRLLAFSMPRARLYERLMPFRPRLRRQCYRRPPILPLSSPFEMAKRACCRHNDMLVLPWRDAHAQRAIFFFSRDTLFIVVCLYAIRAMIYAAFASIVTL